MIRFVKTISPCVFDAHIAWHIEHGCVRDVVTADGRRIGVFYATSLAGHGVVIHFSVNHAASHSWQEFLAAIRKGVHIICKKELLLAMVAVSNSRLIGILKRMGFTQLTEHHGFALLQWNKQKRSYIKRHSITTTSSTTNANRR